MPTETMQLERPALLTQIQAARILGVSPRTLKRLTQKGTVTPIVIAGLGRPRFRRADIEALIGPAQEIPGAAADTRRVKDEQGPAP